MIRGFIACAGVASLSLAAASCTTNPEGVSLLRLKPGINPPGEAVTLSAIGTNLLDTEYEYPEYIVRATQTIPGGPGRAFYGRVTASF